MLTGSQFIKKDSNKNPAPKDTNAPSVAISQKVANLFISFEGEYRIISSQKAPMATVMKRKPINGKFSPK